ncbi:MAG: hypothetical protein QM204_06890 [Bacillota bacterium]|jgi:hypothetical protein|nr:hypothetical protein [Bacillota bacterium]NLL26550.1 hypothetical protein [Erysipelotrichia bacterium]
MKKLLVFMMTLLMVLTMVGCGPTEPEIKEPELVALTEEGALEAAQNYPMSVMSVKRLVGIFDETAISFLFPIMGMENVEDGEVKISAEDLQAKLDELHGKGLITVEEIVGDSGCLVDGYVVGTYEDNGYYTEIVDREFTVAEVADNYISVKEVTTYILKNDEFGVSYDMEDITIYVIYPTVDGLKVYDFGVEKVVTYPEVVE